MKGGESLREYEVMFILPPELEEEAATTATERVRSYVTGAGGTVHSIDVWGRRRLAYPIERHGEGVYHLAKFTLEPEHAIELDRNLRLNEQVLRHLIVCLDS
jgi:small subunit ribosomal protein S6